MKKKSNILPISQISNTLSPTLNPYFLAILFFSFFLFLFFNYPKYMPFSIDIFVNFFKMTTYKNYHNFDISYVIGHFYRFFEILLVYAASFGFGSFFLKFFNFSSLKNSEFNIFSIALGISFLILMVFLLGILGILHKILLFFILGIGVIVFVKNIKFFRINFSYFKSAGLIEKIFLFFGFAALFYILPNCLVPETFYDALAYQIAAPKIWLSAHKIFTIPFNFLSEMPLNLNLFYLIGLALDGEILAKNLNFTFLIVTIYSIASFCKKFFNLKTGIFAIVIFLISPSILIFASRIGLETGLIFFEFLAIFGILNFVNSPEKSDKKKWLILAGVMSGIALGSKYTSAMCFVSINSAILFYEVFFQKSKPKQIFLDLILFSFVAVLVASPWYLKNFVNWGNPFVPLAKFLGATDTDRFMQYSDLLQIKWTLKKFLLFPWYITNGALQQESFPGFLFIFLLPIVFFCKNVRREIKFLNFYAIIYTVCALTIAKGYLRYFCPILTIYAIIFAYYTTNVKTNFLSNLLLIFSLPILFLNLSSGIILTHQSYNSFETAIGLLNKEDYLSTGRMSYPNPYFKAAKWINENTQKDAKILCIGETRGYYFERETVTSNPGSMTPIVEFTKKCKSGDELATLLKQKNFTHIFISEPEVVRLKVYGILYWNIDDIKIYDDFFQNYLTEVFSIVANLENNGRLISESYPNDWALYQQDPTKYVRIYEINSTRNLNKKWNLLATKYPYQND